MTGGGWFFWTSKGFSSPFPVISTCPSIQSIHQFSQRCKEEYPCFPFLLGTIDYALENTLLLTTSCWNSVGHVMAKLFQCFEKVEHIQLMLVPLQILLQVESDFNQ